LLNSAVFSAGSQTPLDATVRHLPIDLIRPGTYQARRSFDPERIAELAASIRESGVVQPVVVRSLDDGYELLAGERRWRAAQQAQLHEIPAILRDDLSDDEAMVLGLIENLQRESLTPIEAAAGLQFLADHYELTHAEAAKRIGKSREYVSNYLRLLKLAEPVQKLVNERLLTLGHAKALAGLPAAMQPGMAMDAVSGGWSVRVLESRCRAALKDRTAGERAPRRDAQWQALERELTEALGNKVAIDFDGARGELRVAFHSLDEFDGILERLGVRTPGE